MVLVVSFDINQFIKISCLGLTQINLYSFAQREDVIIAGEKRFLKPSVCLAMDKRCFGMALIT